MVEVVVPLHVVDACIVGVEVIVAEVLVMRRHVMGVIVGVVFPLFSMLAAS